MDLEELNKTQIILVTLLVSFVSAIATSIFTVKILEQAPPAVTQTINRVVERTVERVVPAEPNELGTSEPTVIEKETTVVVKEDDLITESIEKNKSSLARLVLTSNTASTGTTTPGTTGTSTSTITVSEESEFVGMGVFIRNDGLIATSKKIAETKDVSVMTHTGTIYKTELIGVDNDTNTGFLKLILPQVDSKPNYRVAVFVDSSSLKLGQTVISLGGKERTNVSLGIISSLVETTISSEDTPILLVGSVETNINNTISGEPLINIFGELVGIDVRGDSSGEYISSSLLQRSVSALKSSTSEESTTDTAESNSTILES